MYRYVYELLTADYSQAVGWVGLVVAAFGFWKATTPQFRKFLSETLKWTWDRVRSRGGSKPERPPKSVNSLWAGLTALSFLVFVATVVGPAVLHPPGPRAVLMKRMWRAVEKERWEEARSLAEKCVDEYGDMAKARQKELEGENAPKPVFQGWTEQDKKRMLAEGLVNDVAACYWVSARAWEKLPRIDAAIAAYEETAKFTYAAIWDPEGSFWSPAKSATARRETLRAKGDRK